MRIYNIDRETETGYFKYLELLKPGSWLFQAIEKKFDAWLSEQNPAGEYDEKYFGSEAIYTKKGAIEGAIEMIFDQMDEDKSKFILLKDVDLAAAFQD